MRLVLSVFLALNVCLAPVHGITPESSKDAEFGTTFTTTTEASAVPTEAEKLMEDTQHKLQDAVHQMDNESAKSSQSILNLTSNYNNESSSEAAEGNQSTRAEAKIDKLSENVTQEIRESRTIILSNGKENDADHECIIDEDCDKGKYCLYQPHHSKCLPCNDQDSTCTKDEECCEDRLCVWGQCTKNVTKGEAGTICQYQSDCSSDLCCAFHKALLYPVCSTKPRERERCIISANHLMELLSWDMEGEGAREHCPCTGDLQCQHLGRGSLCLKGQSSSEEDLTDTLYSEIDYIV